jgi:hypothetical protein
MRSANCPADTADAEFAHASLPAETWLWVRDEGVWWAASFVFHGLLMVVLMLLSVSRPQLADRMGGVEIESADLPPPDAAPPLERVESFTPQVEYSQLNPLIVDAPPQIDTGTPRTLAASSAGETLAGVSAAGTGGVGMPELGVGRLSPFAVLPQRPLPGGFATGPSGPLSGRDEKSRSALRWTGVTRGTDRSVGAALNWIARHQARDGSWSLDGYRMRCTDATCSGPGTQKADAAATALGLLPLLAAGHRHDRPSTHQKAVGGGIYWLVSHQRADGDLSAGSSQRMYSHGLAAIALCEAYAMSADPRLRTPAQRAVDFIEASQHPRTGGWRYQPGDEGDTSVFGWQLMALKSAEMGALKVRPETFERARQWLGRVAAGKHGGTFSYTPRPAPPTPSMTAVGLLAWQYLNMPRDNPAMVEGAAYLAAHQPDARQRTLYYWYYATQVLHNLMGRPWDDWNRRMRRILVESQVREGCAAGSWDPLRPTRDALGEPGGRLCVTSLATLTLEVYYRHLPLYQIQGQFGPLDASSAGAVSPAAPQE